MKRYLGNQEFDERFYENYIKNIFGEDFSHSSLSTEDLFDKCKECSRKLQSFMSPANKLYYDIVTNYGKNSEIQAIFERKKYFLNYLKYRKAISEKVYYDENNNPLPCLSDFEKYFPYVVRPFINQRELENAANDMLELYMPYENQTMDSRIEALYNLIGEKILADKAAHNHKNDNHNAFLYALDLESIGVPEIIKINEMVNQSDNIHSGFKTVNNTIFKADGQSVATCPKELVPIRMQELIYNYNNEWAEEIKSFNYQEELQKFNCLISQNMLPANDIDDMAEELEEKRQKHNDAVCLREAKFHIEFERIHPFEDGNGRTGRIILNKHLIDNGLAPISIPSEVREQYVSCINDHENGPKRLAEMIKLLSSAQKSSMVSMYRNEQGYRPYELSKSELGNVESVDKTKTIDSSIIEEDTKIYPGPSQRVREHANS